MHALLALLLAATPDPLAAAHKHLQAGNLDGVVLDLDDAVTLAPPQNAEAAEVLVGAAARAQSKKDAVLALQLAQMAHRRDASSTSALALLGELALSDRDDAEAERWSDGWQKLAPQDPHPALLRARIAADEGDWDTVEALAGTLSTDASLEPASRKLARKLLAEADKHQPAPVIAPSNHQAAEAAARDRELAFAAPSAASESEIIIYGTSWCGYCKAARKYFASKQLAFVDKDIEQDHDAEREMVEKLAAAGKRARGVPVLDVRGTIIDGYDEKAIERALQK